MTFCRLLALVPIWLVSVSACSPSKGASETGGDPSAGGGMSGGGATGSGGSPTLGGASGDGGSCDGYETGDVELVRRCLERISCAPVVSEGPTVQDVGSSGDSMSGCVSQAAAATPPCVIDADACTDPPGELHCAGDVLYECVDGARRGVDCAEVAASCVEDVAGEGSCRDTATDCDTPDASTCDGNLLIRCDEEGKQRTIDCSAAGLRCEADGRGAACLAPSCTFEDSAECTESCDGTRLLYCVGGSPTELDCTEFGFAGCEVRGARALCVGEADPLADSCPFARDGECDPPPLCDEGTDTTDCSSSPPSDEL